MTSFDFSRPVLSRFCWFLGVTGRNRRDEKRTSVFFGVGRLCCIPPRVINISVDLLLTTRYSLPLFYLLLLSIHLLAQANKHGPCRKHPPAVQRARPALPVPRCDTIPSEGQGGCTCPCQKQLPGVLRGQSRASSDVFVFSRRSTQHSMSQ